jgi:2-methylisocitrate lyase-like PEP mutase family enzyme
MGIPDIGLLDRTEMTTTVARLATALPDFPIVIDADTGYGNAMSVRFAVMSLARAGAAGISIEDQITPKRCGHFGAKELVSRGEARMKIRAAVQARKDCGLDVVIMARTDARPLYGLDEAVARCQDFKAEGADIIFMEGLTEVDEMRAFVKSIGIPTWGNVSRGQETYTTFVDRATLREIGYRIVTEPTLLFSATAAMKQHLAALAAGDEGAYPAQVTFSQMKDIIGLEDWDRLDRQYAVPSDS